MELQNYNYVCITKITVMQHATDASRQACTLSIATSTDVDCIVVEAFYNNHNAFSFHVSQLFMNVLYKKKIMVQNNRIKKIRFTKNKFTKKGRNYIIIIDNGKNKYKNICIS